MFRGSRAGESSCFNCLRSLADSLGLECLWPRLLLLRTPSLGVSLSQCQTVERFVGRFLVQIVEIKPNITRTQSHYQLFSFSHSSVCFRLLITFLSDWLTLSTLFSVSVHCGAACVQVLMFYAFVHVLSCSRVSVIQDMTKRFDLDHSFWLFFIFNKAKLVLTPCL